MNRELANLVRRVSESNGHVDTQLPDARWRQLLAWALDHLSRHKTNRELLVSEPGVLDAVLALRESKAPDLKAAAALAVARIAADLNLSHHVPYQTDAATTLVAALASSSFQAQLYAATALANKASDAATRQAIRDTPGAGLGLVRLLTSSHSPEQALILMQAAMRALKDLHLLDSAGDTMPENITALVALLHSNNPTVQQEAAAELADLADDGCWHLEKELIAQAPGAAFRLVQLLRSKSNGVQLAAARVLVCLASDQASAQLLAQNGRALREIVALLHDSTSSDDDSSSRNNSDAGSSSSSSSSGDDGDKNGGGSSDTGSSSSSSSSSSNSSSSFSSSSSSSSSSSNNNGGLNSSQDVHAVRLLACLARDEDIGHRIMEIDGVTKSLVALLSSSNVQQLAAEALANLASEESRLQDEAHAEGAISGLVELLSSCNNLGVQQEAARALSNLAAAAANRWHIFHAKGLKEGVVLMLSSADNAVRAVAAELLEQLAQDSSIAEHMAGVKAIIANLVDMLHSKAASVVEAAAAALHQLAAWAGSSWETMVEVAGLLDGLEALLDVQACPRSTPAAAQDAAYALSYLSGAIDLEEAAAKGGGAGPGSPGAAAPPGMSPECLHLYLVQLGPQILRDVADKHSIQVDPAARAAPVEVLAKALVEAGLRLEHLLTDQLKRICQVCNVACGRTKKEAVRHLKADAARQAEAVRRGHASAADIARERALRAADIASLGEALARIRVGEGGKMPRRAYRDLLAANRLVESDQDVYHIISEANGGANHISNYHCAQNEGLNRAIGCRHDYLNVFLAGLEKAKLAVAVSREFGSYTGPDAEVLYEQGKRTMFWLRVYNRNWWGQTPGMGAPA